VVTLHRRNTRPQRRSGLNEAAATEYRQLAGNAYRSANLRCTLPKMALIGHIFVGPKRRQSASCRRRWLKAKPLILIIDAIQVPEANSDAIRTGIELRQHGILHRYISGLW